MLLHSVKNCLGSRLVAAVLVALTACDSAPTATNSSNAKNQPIPAASATGPAVSPTPASPDTLVSAAPPLSGDVPSLHSLTVADDTTVAPGLVVSYHSIPRADTFVVRDPGDIKIAFTIRQAGKEIYRDTTDGFAYDLAVLEPPARHLYPLWIPTGPGRGELLTAFDNRPLKALARRFFIEPGRVARIDTLLTFDGPARDVDQDGRPEFSGFYSWGEQWQDTRGRRRQMYIPTLYYEVRSSGLILDSTLTQRKAKAQYGAFYGYKDSDKPIIYAK